MEIVTIAQYAFDRVLMRVLKLSTYRLQMFLGKYECLRSIQPCEDQDILRKLKNLFANIRGGGIDEGRREIMTGEKGGVIGREKGD